MIVNRSSIAACFGKCSQNETPGSFVGITPNGPRFWSGRSGFGSQVSIWLGPPAIQSRITDLLPLMDRPASDAWARSRSSAGRLSPARPARLALIMFRRPAMTTPSRSVGFMKPERVLVVVVIPSAIVHPAPRRRFRPCRDSSPVQQAYNKK